MKKQALLFLLSLTFIVSANQKPQFKQAQNYATVGSGGCDFSSIQAAIDSGKEEIRMVQGSFSENILLDRTTIMMGGYADCASAGTNSNRVGRTTIDGSNLAVALYIQATTGNSFFILSQLNIINGKAGDSDLGAGIVLNGNQQTYFQISDSSIQNNTGSGIAVLNAGSVHIIHTDIANNTDFNGGGIYSFSSSIIVYGNSTIKNNTATNNGGGIYLTNQSNFNMLSNTTANNIQGIDFNSANNNGGGIYADSASFVYIASHDVQLDTDITGNNASSVSISYNQAGANNANGDGGGVYLTGNTTEMRIFGAQFLNNNASNNGGGIAVSNNAILTFSRLPQYACISNNLCNRMLQNQAGTNNSSGGAIFAESGATLLIGNVSFEENNADFGSAIYLIDSNTTANIEGSVFARHTPSNTRDGNYIIRAFTGSQATIAFSTFADNEAQLATFGLFNATANLYGDIIYDSAGGQVMNNSNSVNENYCVMAHDISNLSGTTIKISLVSPFIDNANNDYHIKEISLAVDVCNATFYQPTLKDMDSQERAHDTPIGNGDGPYDIGADETYFDEIIFANGFE